MQSVAGVFSSFAGNCVYAEERRVQFERENHLHVDKYFNFNLNKCHNYLFSKISIFWGVTPCSLVDVYRHLGRTRCFHFELNIETAVMVVTGQNKLLWNFRFSW
jgi:hypothetical protein